MKNAKSQASILACKHFNKQNNNFHQHVEFTLIEQIRKQTTDEETRTRLKRIKKQKQQKNVSLRGLDLEQKIVDNFAESRVDLR